VTNLSVKFAIQAHEETVGIRLSMVPSRNSLNISRVTFTSLFSKLSMSDTPSAKIVHRIKFIFVSSKTVW